MATIDFERIGRTHYPPPLTVDSDDPDIIAEAVYRHARPHLRSRDVEVVVDGKAVRIYAGIQNAGTGTIR